MKRAARAIGWLAGHAITALMAALVIVVVMPTGAPPADPPLTEALVQGPIDPTGLQPPPPEEEPETQAPPSDLAAPEIGPPPVATSEGADPSPERSERTPETPADGLEDLRPPALPETGDEPTVAPETFIDVQDDARPPALPEIGRAPPLVREAAVESVEAVETATLPEAANAPPPDPETAAARCGDPRLVGVALEPLDDAEEPLCGAPEPVRVDAILLEGGSVALSPGAQMRCRAARLLADWTEEAAAPLAATVLKERLTTMTVVDAYSCRNRRGGDDASARLSEHALAKAIDIAAFTLESGRVVRLESGWSGALDERVYLRALWRAACDRFGTVLGPLANEAHRDHFHFDAAQRRRAYCR